ncbi:MAG TPA: FtsW/RodA/SpoVE family cell cycle protein [Candidatus Saccharimonadales bacterium]|nr:FtsW/RodA/SpoVE family cell cycle protein [Candidatus Saccharimonadales bacterium]
MSAPARPVPAPSLPRILGPIRPRPRWTEARLLVLVALALVVGSLSLGMTRTGEVTLHQPAGLAIYLGALALAHLAQVVAGRRSDQILLPTVGMLGGISLLLMQRLPQGLVTQEIGSTELGLGEVQLVWLVLAIGVATTLGIVVRSDSWLRRYKYTWAAVGIALLLAAFVFGTDTGGSRLTLRFGPISGQPSELLKVILVVFLAGYLSENRPLLIEQDTRLGPLRLPPLPYLAPMVAMWAIALGIVVIQRDLGAALLFFGVFLALVYAATGRLSLVLIGTVLFFAGSALMVVLFDHVRTRIDIWIDPFADPLGAGYQVVQSLHAFARGGLLGMGLGNGLPLVGGRIPIPEVHTDFPLAALGEELGLVGVIAILGLFLVVVERGLRIGAAAADDFRAILATGLALVVGVQAFIIAAGNLKVLPLTGVTLPFISYGGSSLLANAVVVGLLLALSDKGVEPPPPPSRPTGWRGRIARARAGGAA